MIKLIRKDLLLHKKFLLGIGIVAPLYLGYMGSRLNNLMMLPIFGGFIYGVLPIILFSRESKFKSESFGLSLPVTRREFLKARFLLSWGMIFLMYAVGSIVMVVVPGGKLGVATVFSLHMVQLCLAFITVYFGFLMPLVIRFGQAGLLVFVVALQLTGVLLMVFRSFIGVTIIKKLFRVIPDGVAAAQSLLGEVPAFLAVIVLLALLTYGSFELSAAFLRKKEF